MAARHPLLHRPYSSLSAEYWKSEREGLVPDVAPWLDLERLQTEITKVISLREIDLMAMLSLLEHGEAEFELPEFLFDIDYPGHYCHHIVSASVSLSNVCQAATNLSYTLTLQKHKYRISPVSDDYAAQPIIHFQTNRVSITSSAITSGNGKTSDLIGTMEGYASFEGAGAISSWKLSLASNIQQSDHSGFTDLVMRVRYTATIGPAHLKNAASCAVAAWTSNRMTYKSYYGQTLSKADSLEASSNL